MQALVIDVMEDPGTAKAWAEKLGWSIPVLLDKDGAVSKSYAPEGVLPDWVSSALPSNQYEIGLRLFPDYLEIGDPAAIDAADSVKLPKTDPLMLEIDGGRPRCAGHPRHERRECDRRQGQR